MMAADSVKLSRNLLRMKLLDHVTVQGSMNLISSGQSLVDVLVDSSFRDSRCAANQQVQVRVAPSCWLNLIIEERSFVPCEDLRFGRVSFKGFNPEVEKLMVLMNPKEEKEERDEEDERRMQTDVTDEEMALRYESLVGSMKKKFAKKRERAAMDEDENQNVVETEPKRVFLKPQD
ncbi:M-phase phosphoprotein 6 isoform X1 [Stegastes partitus]|uniref:M-phase phosphoprotein 6 isoform X1 n=1 Tax=Stegastes partitus TaxID=144197 RepID=A0A9Y4KBW7_9TELE|nr:PREDICTED: M-phase phosphoprotein 6 isoform X1 [Stegastes partitus]